MPSRLCANCQLMTTCDAREERREELRSAAGASEGDPRGSAEVISDLLTCKRMWETRRKVPTIQLKKRAQGSSRREERQSRKVQVNIAPVRSGEKRRGEDQL